jgi:hypothetical protein
VSIPAEIVEKPYQRSRISVVIAWKFSPDAHPIKRSALLDRPPGHTQNIKSP